MIKSVLIYLFICITTILLAQDLTYNKKSWAVKDGVSKNKIQIPSNLVKKHKMKLVSENNGQYLFYIIKNSNIDRPAYQIHAAVFQSSEEAQTGLLNFLNSLTSPKKLQEISKEYSINADIAFGNIKSETSFLVFTKNNVLIVIDASSDIVEDIANEFISIIDDAPEWKDKNAKPIFLLESN